jgi:hypothetical protein
MSDPLNRSLADIMANSVDGDLPAPDTTEPMVTRTFRLPVSMSKLLDEAAASKGIGPTVLGRQFIEAGLADLADTAMVPLADVRRLLASIALRNPAA